MTDNSRFSLLETIDTPADLRALEEDQLGPLAQELREFLIHSVSRSGGHFGANLGAVELTVALHYVFDTPKDHIVWDVGHQTYPHKVLTQRRDKLDTIRKYQGLAPFPKRAESEYDCFGVGHSSTSISAAIGMAIADKLRERENKTVAVIGDGAMTAGMAYEALNHGGDIKADVLVVLNDNEMSISPNVGAMSNYLARLLSGKVMRSMRAGGKRVLSHVPPVAEVARRAEEHMKGMVMPGTLFEEMGFDYFGPIDGHDLETLVVTLRNLRGLQGPRILHVVTRKGKGYKPAEEKPVKYHGVSTFDPAEGLRSSAAGGSPTYTQVFGKWLCDMAEREPRLFGITPAMREGSGLVEFAERFPERYADVAIAEQHSVTLAAGLACEGMKPVVAIYSTFLQRAYDQLIHDVAVQNLPVLFAIDRGGLVGADGPTHAGSFDYTFMRCLPNMVLMAPADENECRQMLYTGFMLDQPTAVRYPRGKGPGAIVEEDMRALAVGKAEVRRRGQGIAILAFGSMVAPCSLAAEELGASLINMRFVKPIDSEAILDAARTHDYLVTVEENAVQGGAGSAVNEVLVYHGVDVAVLNLGLPDRYVDQGSREDLLSECRLDCDGIRADIEMWMMPLKGGLSMKGKLG
jgi:1-deoxy-D-xylulose-5-phosphate synthase